MNRLRPLFVFLLATPVGFHVGAFSRVAERPVPVRLRVDVVAQDGAVRIGAGDVVERVGKGADGRHRYRIPLYGELAVRMERVDEVRPVSVEASDPR